MCGRFSLTARPQEVGELLGVDEIEDFPPRYNIAPTQPILMANIDAANAKAAILVRWGLVPTWVKDPREFTLLLNARSETAATKPSFRNAMRHRRTLVPASGFYEWSRAGDKKQAYWITPSEGGIVMFGGLMETWSSADGGEIDSGCILTTACNQYIGNIHHRMPVVIEPKDFDQWLDCKTGEPRDVAQLMLPIEDGYFKATPVSDRVNKVANSDPDIQKKVAIEAANEIQKDEKPANNQLDLF